MSPWLSFPPKRISAVDIYSPKISIILGYVSKVQLIPSTPVASDTVSEIKNQPHSLNCNVHIPAFPMSPMNFTGYWFFPLTTGFFDAESSSFGVNSLGRASWCTAGVYKKYAEMLDTLLTNACQTQLFTAKLYIQPLHQNPPYFMIRTSSSCFHLWWQREIHI
jgi:hypothetical protein